MAQNLQLRTEMTDLERRGEELTRERDQLNWTLGVIMEYQDLPVKTLCPQKGKHMVSLVKGINSS